MKFGWAYEAPDSSSGIESVPWDKDALARVDHDLEELSSILDDDRYRSSDQTVYDPHKFFNRRIFAPSRAERELALQTAAGGRLLRLLDRLEPQSATADQRVTTTDPEVPSTHP